MKETNTVISVKNVCKDFVLPNNEKNTLKGLFTGVLDGSGGSEVQTALKDISFEVKKGEFFGIVGRNGSGKSTLLKILAEIYRPTKGSIKVSGRLVPFIELGVGFNAELSGRENVYLSASLLGFTRKEIDNMYEDIVKFAELERFMDQKLKNYSSGMQVRLAFSIATRAEGDVLLVDEVLAVGDADFQRKCFNHFRELKKNKKTVVFVSHDMNSIREYCDRAVLIESSKLIHSGDPDKVAIQYSRLFDGSNSAKNSMKTKRWGDKTIKANSVSVTPASIIDSNRPASIKITIDVKANKDIEDPLFGFRIRNAAGKAITGTNTQIKKIKYSPLKKGDALKVQWEIEHIFSGGVYYVDSAIVYENGSINADWWEEAASFEVKTSEQTPYIVNPRIKVNLIHP
jgi:ABC-2 type transport system ATP-binding protein